MTAQRAGRPVLGAARRALSGPGSATFVPALSLAAFTVGGPAALLGVALSVPVLHALVREGERDDPPTTAEDGVTGLVRRDGVLRQLDRILSRDPARGTTTACLVVELDREGEVSDRLGNRAAEAVTRRLADRIVAACRTGDCVGRLRGNSFAIALAPMRRADLEAVIQIATRLQSAVSEPIPIEATTLHVTASIGFCLPSRAPGTTGEAMLGAAEAALAEARRTGPATIRAYSAEMHERVSSRLALVAEAEEALEAGQIVPWFQPQICTDTGAVTGFEALARWIHPERGMMSPADFLPAIEHAGLMERLGEAMLYRALAALRTWDRMGLEVPTVSVNFSTDDLRSPTLLDRVKWELDRFDLGPERLTVEVLETVVSGGDDDAMTRNLHRLEALGCRIDLDDFGTGNASIGNIRRFAISRIKIDRSYVDKVEDDPEQQRMISAILTMSERLGLDTLAEGVETPAAHTILAQLGCGHVQGFGVARPMTAEDAARWMERQASQVSAVPSIAGRKAG